MATKKCSYLRLPMLMVFALILLPIISGQYYKCMKDGCISTLACDAKCTSMGYPRGGSCRAYSYGGVCCCECTSKQCQHSLISSPPY
ncbi:hypothetical protein EUTSA_v10027228mg [Eutrema salsugineum]|uniref:Knottin scorpion toxin-like domain-containing protein n=1 Tax=Eutrema salsugineum TaxID=72664 RepID=V4MD82_EUTSA|nr:hypothetical protein EUTSA_v10027228mg [Eutrema salsugineum]